jgi:hypothetical protein
MEHLKSLFSDLQRLDGRTLFFGLFLLCLLDWYGLSAWGLSLGSIVANGLPPQLQSVSWAWVKPAAQLMLLIVLCQGLLLPMVVLGADQLLTTRLLSWIVTPTSADIERRRPLSLAQSVLQQAAASNNATLYAQAQTTLGAADDHRARRLAAWGAFLFLAWAWAIDTPQQPSLLSLWFELQVSQPPWGSLLWAGITLALVTFWCRVLLDLDGRLVGYMSTSDETRRHPLAG